MDGSRTGGPEPISRRLDLVAMLSEQEWGIVEPPGRDPLTRRLIERGADGLDIGVTRVDEADLAPAIDAVVERVTAIRTAAPDATCAVVFGAEATTATRTGPGGVPAVRAELERMITSAKALDTTVLVVAPSTYDPAGDIHTYQPSDDPPVVAVHRFLALLVELSQETGISLVDLDRLVARIGGSACVPRLGHLGPSLADAGCEELARIIEEYGLIDDRPLLAQRGRRRRSA